MIVHKKLSVNAVRVYYIDLFWIFAIVNAALTFNMYYYYPCFHQATNPMPRVIFGEIRLRH